MSESILPGQEKPKLIVIVAFDRGEDGELFTAFGPTDQRSEDRTIRTARTLASSHAGVIAWSRYADPLLGDYGAPTTLFASGEVPDME
ncbi:hypothetical protein [Mesorhizobium loti]|uniref:Uncharacterized protein n=1 Tax=Mesorhizobium loti R88b TaxID=935548 RepID=A0A6M7WM82_RHILI|nr:hypothetical protein [Mesorhizobium loti]QKD03522.1 hypothetical protein EB235_20195 [Mesorhizobium loti R88b]